MSVFECIRIRIGPASGCHIRQMCQAAQSLANFTKHSIIFSFNGVELSADRHTTALGLEEKYYIDLHE